MAGYFRNLPFFVVLLFTAAGAMLVPSVYGLAVRDHDTARVFFYTGLLVAVVAVLLGFATQARRRTDTDQKYLISLLLSYLWLPVVLGLPMFEAVGFARAINVYFDMVSALTTTGAPVFEPARLADTVHLWRATVGWFGGILIWITAMAVLAPLNLGGFEVTSEANNPGQRMPQSGQMRAAAPADRLRRHAAMLAPVYLGLTATLALALVLAGERPLNAVIHAMSTLSTSGITAAGGLKDAGAGFAGEVLIALFLVFALTRRSFTSGVSRAAVERVVRDREVRLALLTVVVLTTVLFARHWLGAYEVDELADAGGALAALWGAAFTMLSFLTTAGFVSESWAGAQSWSGLETSGLILVGVAIMGGGVATTAGGLKLLRVYALYKHGAREIERLVHPHSVAGAGRLGRRIRREGAFVAWIFFMLFLTSVAAVMLALTAAGLPFEQALMLAIAALSTCGPLASVAGTDPVIYLALGDGAKLILAAAMIVGRMETLVFIAVFNPTFWRS
ncbi:potassium transporter TrkG [Roseicyclus mahoneyensis]|uniref:Trk system potassium uptake protein TrkH n=1 Tax=Roseicyclus mahoneyensis TaxID=164332 RepID=A0A316GNK6_9RHOB|nr:potassium transporter TrkG [Roseicyclus mahoneyensis]PWK62625.1 trk system potassium uptake protein TrkH [Roseicyclus mahoneyensis]